MSTHPPTQSTYAVPVTVHAGDGSNRTGYVIRTDTVLLVEPGFLALPLEVEIADGLHISVAGIHLAKQIGAEGEALCSLELPEGTAVVDGDLTLPPDLMPSDLIPPDDLEGTTSIWCRMFPRIPGC